MHGLTFDWTISASAVLIAGTQLAALAAVGWRLSVRFTLMERRVNLMFAWFLRQISGNTATMTAEEIREFFGVVKGS